VRRHAFDSLYSLDPDLNDELEKAGIRPGPEEFEEAMEAKEHVMAIE
jgi:hypothetical protein